MKNSIYLILICMFFSARSYATPDGLTFQGRLTDNGIPVEGSPVYVTLKITSPGAEACVLFEETHTLNLTNSGGVFSVKVGGGSRTLNDRGFDMSKIFSNSGQAITGLSCTSGSSYTPLTADTRKIFVSFIDGATTVSFPSPYVIQSVPYAIESQKLAGKNASDFLQTLASLESTPGTTQNRMSRILDTDYSALDALLNGTSSHYMTTSNSGPAKLPVLTSSPSTPVSGNIWYEGGELKYYDGASSSVKTLGTTAAYTTLAGYGITDGVRNGGQAGAVSVGPSNGNALTLQTNGSSRMTITSTGRVGIGTSSPTADLEVSGQISFSHSSGSAYTPTGTTASPAAWSLSLANLSYLDNAGAVISSRVRSAAAISQTGYQGFISQTAGYSPAFVIGRQTATSAYAESVRIDGSGNVGIGTSDPKSSLQVNGYIQLALVSGAPPAADCDNADERGRMKIDDTAGTLYICAASGWVAK